MAKRKLYSHEEKATILTNADKLKGEALKAMLKANGLHPSTYYAWKKAAKAHDHMLLKAAYAPEGKKKSSIEEHMNEVNKHLADTMEVGSYHPNPVDLLREENRLLRALLKGLL